MTEPAGLESTDLIGSVDDRLRQLIALDSAGPLPADWLRRQLYSALRDWAGDDNVLDVESREDY
jgi:hypothetical protein